VKVTALWIIAWILLSLSVWAFALWAILLVRFQLMLRGRATVRDGLDLPAPEGVPATLSIIVPAHNEEDLIDTCASLLRRQVYPDLQIIFVADRCTDETLERLQRHAAADPRIVVVTNTECPSDWTGKCRAAHCGAEHATGEWLLFTDADTRFDPRLARAAVALALARDLDLLTLLSTLTYERIFERVAQPAASFNLMRLYPISRVSSRSPRPFANGQFLLFRRAAYERTGGHAAVRDALLEDIAFARKIRADGGRSLVAFADGMLTCTMYDSLAAFESGWKRIFIEVCDRKPARLRKEGWRTIGCGTMLPLVQVAALAIAPLVAAGGDKPLGAALVAAVLAGWCVQAMMLLRSHVQARAPRHAVVLFPLGSLIVGRVMLAAARDLEQGTPLVWGQRQYVLEPR
jgi:GT2 family glycosyltransferase